MIDSQCNSRRAEPTRHIVDDNGEVVLVIPEGRDISERKADEEKLRLTAQVMENAAEGILITDHSARVIDVNVGFCEISGFTREEVLGRRTDLD